MHSATAFRLSSPPPFDHRQIVRVGLLLRDADYSFVTVTPESHRRVLARNIAPARDLRDVFGWSKRFSPSILPTALATALLDSGAVQRGPDGLYRSTVRYSTLGDGLYVHSAYPTTSASAVFFGPDTYRYCGFLRRACSTARHVVDIGCGSGAGGLALADRVDEIILADINPTALAFARVNAELAGVQARVRLVQSDVLRGVDGRFDLAICNPPYLVDPQHRVYRDGGGAYGTELALRIADEALDRLLPKGRLLMYTGAPVVAGVDVFAAALGPRLCDRAASTSYAELDVDVFGEELDTPTYLEVDRIAAVAVDVTRRA